MTSKDIIRKLGKDGWYCCGQKVSHMHFKHPIKSGRVTVPHPKKDFPHKTVNSILKQAQLSAEVH